MTSQNQEIKNIANHKNINVLQTTKWLGVICYSDVVGYISSVFYQKKRINFSVQQTSFWLDSRSSLKER